MYTGNIYLYFLPLEMWDVSKIDGLKVSWMVAGSIHWGETKYIHTRSICYPFVFVSILLFGIIIVSMNSQKLLKHYAIGPNIDQSVKLLFTQEGYLQTYSGAM